MPNKSEEKLRLLESCQKSHRYSGRYPYHSDIVPPENRLAVAWTIAAEGTISISSPKKGVPKLRVSNTEKDFVLRFHELVAGAGGVFDGHKNRPGRKDDYFWQLRSIPGVYKVLTEIIDFLPIKRQVALAVMEFCESRMSHFGFPLSQLEKDLIYQVRVLNERRHRKDGAEDQREAKALSAII